MQDGARAVPDVGTLFLYPLLTRSRLYYVGMDSILCEGSNKKQKNVILNVNQTIFEFPVNM